MTDTLQVINDFLMKARRRLSDENLDYSDIDEEQDLEGLDSEFTPDDDEDDEASQFLREHDNKDDVSEEENADSEAVSQEEKPVAARPPIKRESASPQRIMMPSATSPTPSGDLQPTREELMQMREYTRPWEQRARDKGRLEAEAHINPVKHHHGRLIEARETSHANRQKAYEALTQSPEFQNADPITQMEMEGKFHDDWHNQNPDYLTNVFAAHNEAHKKGGQAKDLHAKMKDEKIRHIAGGGVNPEAVSFEEGLQHVGGSREDEDSAPSGISQDKSAAFASGNQEFINQYMQNYDKKAKKFSNVSDIDNLDPETRADVNTVLGDHPALKDPAKKRQVDQFVSRYHPYIGKAARHVLSKLGLTDKANRGEIDPGLLHEAGVHALFQAVNDYNHDHPSKAKFTTHLSRKMHGLMQSALKAHDEIPVELRAGAKKFEQQKRAEMSAPVKHTNKEGVTTIIQPPKRSVAEIASAHHPDIQDRLKRVVAAKAPVIRKQPAAAPVQPKPPGPRMKDVRNVTIDEDGE